MVEKDLIYTLYFNVNNDMIEIGKINTLKVVKEVDFGLYLDGGDEFGEILLPTRYVADDMEVDHFVDVFIYNDSEDRIIATTDEALAEVDEYAYLKCISVTKFGAFLDWGLAKDLLVPFKEQATDMQEGLSYFVRVYFMDQLILNIRPPEQKTFENYVFGKNAEIVSTLKDFDSKSDGFQIIYLWGMDM